MSSRRRIREIQRRMRGIIHQGAAIEEALMRDPRFRRGAGKPKLPPASGLPTSSWANFGAPALSPLALSEGLSKAFGDALVAETYLPPMRARVAQKLAWVTGESSEPFLTRTLAGPGGPTSLKAWRPSGDLPAAFTGERSFYQQIKAVGMRHTGAMGEVKHQLVPITASVGGREIPGAAFVPKGDVRGFLRDPGKYIDLQKGGASDIWHTFFPTSTSGGQFVQPYTSDPITWNRVFNPQVRVMSRVFGANRPGQALAMQQFVQEEFAAQLAQGRASLVELPPREVVGALRRSISKAQRFVIPGLDLREGFIQPSQAARFTDIARQASAVYAPEIAASFKSMWEEMGPLAIDERRAFIEDWIATKVHPVAKRRLAQAGVAHGAGALRMINPAAFVDTGKLPLLTPREAFVFGDVANKRLYQKDPAAATPMFLGRGASHVSGYERSRFGRMMPRAVTTSHQRRWQQLLSKARAPLSGYSQTAADFAGQTTPMAQQMWVRTALVPQKTWRRGLLGREMAHTGFETEQLILSSEAAEAVKFGAARGRGRAAIWRNPTIGTAFNVGGSMGSVSAVAASEAALGGFGGVASLNLLKDPAATLEVMLGSAMHQASEASRGRLQGVDVAQFRRGLKSQFGIDIKPKDLRQARLVHKPNKTLAKAFMGTSAKRVLGSMAQLMRQSGMEPAYQAARLEGRTVLSAVMPWRVRTHRAPAFAGYRYNPFDMVSLAAAGPASAKFADRLNSQVYWGRAAGMRSYGDITGATFARRFFATLTPLLGREPTGLGVGGLRHMAGTEGLLKTFAEGLQKRRWTAQKLASFWEETVQKGNFHRVATSIQLPEGITVPTRLTLGVEGKGTTAKELAALKALEKTPARRAIDKFVMPPMTRSMLEVQQRLLVDPEARVALQAWTRSLGETVGEITAYHKAVREGADPRALAGQFGRVQGAIDAYYEHLAGIMGTDEIRALVTPRIAGAYTQITGALPSGYRHLGGPRELGLGRIGVDPDVARRLLREQGMRVDPRRYKLIKRYLAGEAVEGVSWWPGEVKKRKWLRRPLGATKAERILMGREAFMVGHLANPAIGPGTVRAAEARVLPELMGTGTTSTNVWTRIFSFRDLDNDAMQIIAIGMNQHDQRIARAAWKEQNLILIEWIKGMRRDAKAYMPDIIAAAQSQGPMVEALAGKVTPAQLTKLVSGSVMPAVTHATLQAFQEVASATGTPGRDLMNLLQTFATEHQTSVAKGGKAGKGGVFALMKRIAGDQAEGPENYKKLVREIRKLHKVAALQDIAVGSASPEEMAKAAQVISKNFVRDHTNVAEVFKKKKLTPGRMMQIFETLSEGPVQELHEKLIGLGKPTSGEAGALVEEINLALKEEAATAGRDVFTRASDKVSGLWNKLPSWGKWAVGGIGALLGLRIISSHLFGDEPGPGPGMRISPELAARHAMQGQFEGSPLPPDPMVMPGLHQQMQRPYVPFSPPSARMRNSLATSPSLSMDVSEMGSGDSAHSIGVNMAQLTSTSQGTPLTGVFSVDSHEQYGGKIDRIVERERIDNSRIYNPKTGRRA